MTDFNMTTINLVLANLTRSFFGRNGLSPKFLLKTLFRYRSKFKNYFIVLIKVNQKKYPININLKGDGKRIVNNKGQIISLVYNIDYDDKSDIINLEKMGYPIKLFSAIENGETIVIFYDKEYNFLQVKEKVVVDVGANIADSSIYFACEGALPYVIALEPHPKNYETAKRNIELNGLNQKISLLNAGCGSTDDTVLIDPDYAGLCKPLIKSTTGTTIELITLQSLVDRFKIESAILKLDCEGCEYDIILKTPENILKKFSQIQIEYHYGYMNLYKRLKEVGFDISVTRPCYRENRFAKDKDMYMGWLYATYPK